MIPSMLGKKKAVSMILGMHGEPDKAEGDENPLHVIARELVDAIKSEDVAKIAESLEAAWACMEAKEYEEE